MTYRFHCYLTFKDHLSVSSHQSTSSRSIFFLLCYFEVTHTHIVTQWLLERNNSVNDNGRRRCRCHPLKIVFVNEWQDQIDFVGDKYYCFLEQRARVTAVQYVERWITNQGYFVVLFFFICRRSSDSIGICERFILIIEHKTNANKMKNKTTAIHFLTVVRWDVNRTGSDQLVDFVYLFDKTKKNRQSIHRYCQSMPSS